MRSCPNCTVNMTLSSLFVIFFMSWLIWKIRQKNISSPTGLFAGVARGYQGKSKKYFKVNSSRGFAEVFCLANKDFILKQKKWKKWLKERWSKDHKKMKIEKR